MTRGGYQGKLLDVNLSTGAARAVALPPEDELRTWIGCAGLGLHLLAREITPRMRPTDPDCPVFIMTGPLLGTLAPSSSNWTIVTLNPAIPYHPAVTQAHGYWGARLKHAGWDGIVIRGAADRPVYLWIDDEQVALRDASPYWGLGTFETQRRLASDLGDPANVSVACIGPAGESLLLGASVRNDKAYGCNKGSPGLTLGAKKLKAIAVRGSGRVPVADMAGFLDTCDAWSKRLAAFGPDSAYVRRMEGGGLKWAMAELARRGIIPGPNYTSSEWGVRWGERFGRDVARWIVKPVGSWQCPVQCHHETTVTTGPFAGLTTSGYGPENIEGAATIIGVDEPSTCMALANFYDDMGACPSESGHAIALAFEMYNKGLLSKAETDGLDLTWGNYEAALELFEKMMRREGLGAILARPLKEAAQALGRGAEDMVVHIKGAGSNDHEMRAWGLGMLFSNIVSPAGPTWLGMGADNRPAPDAGYPEPQDGGSPEGKGEAAYRTQIVKGWYDSIGCCWFVTWGVGDIMSLTSRAVACAVGWDDFSREEAFLTGERVITLMRLISLARGFTPAHELDICKKFRDPVPDGPAKGRTIGPYLERMREEYYRFFDWDIGTGAPSAAALARLGLRDYALAPAAAGT